ncbi:T9SS type A sorting domain-containing protein, partial [uncultured Hymenobacter sp.]|uniref:T9SS type A sorting domain-containing protein n=1 Tax=uncultured Hymenobacter sp. TaxID=170016 RepID=UPI0035CAEB2C
YDILRKVGRNTATVETFTVNVTDGQLTLAFSKGAAGADEPKVSAIEVLTTGAARTSVNPGSLAAGQSVQAVSLQNVSAQVQVYPNPSEDGRYQVQLPAVFQQGEVSYQLVSAQGVLVRSGKAKLSGNTLPLDFSQTALAEGMYHLQLTGVKAQAHIKLLRK